MILTGSGHAQRVYNIHHIRQYVILRISYGLETREFSLPPPFSSHTGGTREYVLFVLRETGQPSTQQVRREAVALVCVCLCALGIVEDVPLNLVSSGVTTSESFYLYWSCNCLFCLLPLAVRLCGRLQR